MKCNECEYLKKRGFVPSTFKTYERKKYYCSNGDAVLIKDGELPKNTNFIGLGENTKESLLAIKTCPKWCPLKESKR